MQTLILQSESILFNMKVSDSYENYSSTIWDLYESLRVRRKVLKLI